MYRFDGDEVEGKFVRVMEARVEQLRHVQLIDVQRCKVCLVQSIAVV